VRNPDHRNIPLVVGILALLACQGVPTDDGGSGSLDPGHFDSLTIAPPPKLLVHDVAALTAKVWKDGAQVFPSSIVWHSLDPLIADVSTPGTVTGLHPGTLRVTAATGNVADTVSLKVYGQLRLQSDLFLDLPGDFPMAVDDRVQLGVISVDVSGTPIPEVPPVTWTSSNPAAVSVDASGMVSTHLPNSHATVSAATPDDTVGVQIKVLDFPAGQPASVRIAHGIPGVGTIHFQLSQGSGVSLAYGESIEVPIVSGTLHVSAEGLPPSDPTLGNPSREFLGLIRPGDHLSVYAAGSPQSGSLQAVWPTTASVAPDSVLVRLVQSSPVLVVSLRSPGSTRSGLPELCYFDPGTVSPYFARAAGDFDIIGQNKYEQEQEVGRVAASGPGGHAVTIVLTGGGQQPLGIMTFMDH
jgi:Big-like domain-containing protein